MKNINKKSRFIKLNLIPKIFVIYSHITKSEFSSLMDYKYVVQIYDVNGDDRLFSSPINGLHYFPGPFFSHSRIEELDKLFASETWDSVGSGKNSRKTLQYGYKYNYTTGNTKMQAPPIPPIIAELRELVYRLRITNLTADAYTLNQCIINKYEPGQGINAHTDHNDYDDFVCCFTFNSGGTMEFTNKTTGEKVELWTRPNSLYVMSGDARYKWTHEMRPRKTDVVSDDIHSMKIIRGTRISVTFRTLRV